MLIVVTLLILLSRLPREISSIRVCTPNTQFLFNGNLCFCDNRGYWDESNCKSISRRQSCQAGQIIWQGCNQCICQENGYLLCSNSHCSSDYRSPVRQDLSTYGLRCTPYGSYHVNCSVCVCPASGIASHAHCVKDLSCNSQTYHIDLEAAPKKYCIPNVMYLSPCMQCLCSERGYFQTEKCIDNCKQPALPQIPFRCMPGTLYRIGCNICRCPYSSIPDQALCISANCNQQSKQPTLQALRSITEHCPPQSFSAPRCTICDCSPKKTVNESACLELDCVKVNQLSKHHIFSESCTPGVMVSICSECFCTRNGKAIEKYCSKVCSYQTRLNILEMVVKDTFNNSNLIDKSKITRVRGSQLCTPNSLYIDEDSGRYCLCPENGIVDIKFCIAIAEMPKQNQETLGNTNIEVDYNISCEPNTFVEFDCNTCYCNKNGRIDPNWCTYDDCQAKRLIQESHKTQIPTVDTSGLCQPGAITRFKCNYCICSENGKINENACTQNDCMAFDNAMYTDKLTCEPLAYYEVDCNICFCPRDGIKNVAQCTKNRCEKSILRSDSCIPGQLFSDDCNLCICPPDGNKAGKACTNNVCPKLVSWQLFQTSESSTEPLVNSSRSLDHCFAGEEFVEGCNICACPEQGLKMYATCETMLCDKENREIDEFEEDKTENQNKTRSGIFRSSMFHRPRRQVHNDCSSYNISTHPERRECTPGTMYIIRCQECICPYLGNINNFCRPLPKKMYCEQAFPYYNYLPMGRREIKVDQVNTAKSGLTTTPITPETHFELKIKHDKHTEYKCDQPGTIMDECFICDCELERGRVVVEEHCFKSDSDACVDAKPTFLSGNKVTL